MVMRTLWLNMKQERNLNHTGTVLSLRRMGVSVFDFSNSQKRKCAPGSELSPF